MRDSACVKRSTIEEIFGDIVDADEVCACDHAERCACGTLQLRCRRRRQAWRQRLERRKRLAAAMVDNGLAAGGARDKV